MGGHYRLLAVATAISSILSSAHGGEAADPRSKTDPVSVGSGSSGTSLAPALGLFERAKAALECNVCKTSHLTGTVDDCCVDYSTVDAATKSAFVPLLTQLQKRTFFKYYKINLEKECPFWEEDGQCMMRDCSVCECSPEEIPKPWLEEDERSVVQDDVDVQPGDDCSEQIRKEKACHDHSLTEKTFGKVNHSQSSPVEDEFNPWSEESDAAVWALQDEGVDDFTYVNLELNPEKFTGYSGASAARVWGSIYWENLKGFQDSPCMEKRILFRLLSGLHSSIMTQIANDYRFDDGRWGPNTKMFVNAVGMHPDRLTNMYFAYVFVLRAIGKARPFLMDYNYDTGNPEDDALTRKLINVLGAFDGRVRETIKDTGNFSTSSSRISGDRPCVVPGADPFTNSTPGVAKGAERSSTHAEEGKHTSLGRLPEALRDNTVPMCLRGFDERGLFGSPEDASGGSHADNIFRDGQGEQGLALKEEFMQKFHNISRIMDCVGCEKCKLWGKLETLGLGTALKIMLFSSDDEGQKELASLNRNELIALVNTAAQLAKSVGSVPGWRWLEVKQKGLDLSGRLGMGVTLIAAALVAAAYLWGWFSHRQGVHGQTGLDKRNGSSSSSSSSDRSSSTKVAASPDVGHSGMATPRPTGVAKNGTS